MEVSVQSAKLVSSQYCGRVSVSLFSVVLPEMVLADQVSHLTDVSHWAQRVQGKQW